MYLTQSDQAILKINVGRVLADSSLIRGIIERDKNCEVKSDMRDGVAYYGDKNEILKKDFTKYIVDGTEYKDDNAANNRIPHSFHAELVDQKVEYFLSQQVSLTSKNTALEKKLKEFATEEFYEMLNDMATNASNKGHEWLHFYVNSEGKFDYVIIPAEEIVADYDSSYKKELLSILRYYKVDALDALGKYIQKTKVEVWTGENVTFYIETDKGDFIKDPEEPVNPRPHWVVKFKQGEEVKSVNGMSFGDPPFIRLDNNKSGFTDLKRIKPLIDLYDLILSGFANNIEDIQDAIWNLKGYEGSDLKEFMTNLRKFKAIKTSGEGGVEPHTLEIPVDAKNKLLEIILENIYRFGRGVNLSDSAFAGDITGIAIKFKYARLDMKVNAMIQRMQKFIKELFEWYMYVEDNKQEINESEIEVTFSKKMLVNEKEQIENCQKSMGLVSQETNLANHPWVKDVATEIEKKDAEYGTKITNLDNVAA